MRPFRGSKPRRNAGVNGYFWVNYTGSTPHERNLKGTLGFEILKDTVNSGCSNLASCSVFNHLDIFALHRTAYLVLRCSQQQSTTSFGAGCDSWQDVIGRTRGRCLKDKPPKSQWSSLKSRACWWKEVSDQQFIKTWDLGFELVCFKLVALGN